MTFTPPTDDPFDAPLPRAGSNLHEYSVSEISRALKRTVEEQYGHVRVRGEISAPKRAASGHIYLRLKDADAVLDAVCWRGTASRLPVRPEEGMEVICTGRLSTYPGRSSYQLVIEAMELAGEGALLKLLEERRKRLATEGLFDEDRKRPLPFLPNIIGIITSPTGAVIRDILHRLDDRFPRPVLVWPVLVQGEGAADQIAAAIRGFDAIPSIDSRIQRPDLLIVARGGGSLEDLMAFNEQCVVRAAAGCSIPLISAVGHETDTTLIDFAADRRAPTPTAAAEMAVPVRSELQAQLLDDDRRLLGAMARMIDDLRVRLDGLGRGLGDPQGILETASQRLDDRIERLDLALRSQMLRRSDQVAMLTSRLRHPRQQLADASERYTSLSNRLDTAMGVFAGRTLERHAALSERLDGLSGRAGRAIHTLMGEAHNQLSTTAKLLDSYSYERALDRGFAMVMAGEQPITRAANTTPGQHVSIRFADNAVGATFDGDPGPSSPSSSEGKGPKPTPAPAPKRRSNTRQTNVPRNQGDLF